MLNIYYGRENVDKEKFMYDNVNGHTLIIVPDQYTLEAERQAIKHLKVKGLIDVEIISMSRLGRRLLLELGGGKTTFIDKYGRHMLLSQIARAEKENLKVYRGLEEKNSFIELVNNFISEMKQYNGNADDLKELIDNVENDNYLKKKMEDLYLIYKKYEEKIQGQYTDSEDYISLFVNNIKDSKLVKNNTIWIYGFDSFAPRALDILGQLMTTAKEVNVILTYDKGCRDEEIFYLTGIVMENLINKANEFSVEHSVTKIPMDYQYIDKSPEIIHLESELYAVQKQKGKLQGNLQIIQAANQYNEAESAAAFVTHLTRDENYRYRDIMLVCNDQEGRGSIIERVFAEYGIEVFVDKKRDISNSPIVICIMSLISVAVNKYRTQDIFKALKTGFFGMEIEEIERLENYGIEYRIKGTMWKKDFAKGAYQYGEDGLTLLNSIRQKAIEPFIAFEKIYKESVTVKDFMTALYGFITSQINLPEKIMEVREIQEEVVQIWAKVMEILDQIVSLIGDEKKSQVDIIAMLEAGLSQVEVGMLPPTVDGILMGTMQRSRSGQIKALLVLGANEGILPQDPPTDGLFSEDEKNFFLAQGKEICKVDDIRTLEEKMAIYRNLSKANNQLWISYAVSDSDGKELRPSEIVGTIKSIFPDLELQKDILNQEDSLPLIGGKTNTLRHLTEEMRKNGRKGHLDGPWLEVYQWYVDNQEDKIEKINEGLRFTNEQKPIPVQIVDKLYKKDGGRDLSVSPSRIEKFSKCPFSHFIAYGLKPQEQRVFQIAGREIGDVYHQCLMRVSMELTEENVEVTAPESKWMTISKEECRQMVGQIVSQEFATYRDGLFDLGNEEKYKADRLTEICTEVCWVLIDHVRSGNIKSSAFEVSFGRGKEIEPIEVDTTRGKVYIEGKIDRLDIVGSDKIKIIDYKSGNDKFNIEEARAGYRIQLMLYLKAAQENKRKPAGVFYFHIAEPSLDITGTDKEKLEDVMADEIKKTFRLNGIMVSDEDVVSDIAGEFDGFSPIVQLKNANGKITGTSKDSFVTAVEFDGLQKDVDETIGKLCNNLVSGCIDLTPKKSGDEIPCTFCGYNGICRFDSVFEGCNFDII
ncbi:MAG: PD-(D/E)XK nuclease family protein [Anaerovoracaceae bacterium]